jgi:hypothetical protein
MDARLGSTRAADDDDDDDVDEAAAKALGDSCIGTLGSTSCGANDTVATSSSSSEMRRSFLRSVLRSTLRSPLPSSSLSDRGSSGGGPTGPDRLRLPLPVVERLRLVLPVVLRSTLRSLPSTCSSPSLVSPSVVKSSSGGSGRPSGNGM